MKYKLKGGIIGAGASSFIGFAHMVATYFYGEAEIVAGVFSSNPNKSKARAVELGIKKDRAYTNFRVMINKEMELPKEERIDFVIIATPNALHHEMALAFLKAGIHVFSDKPMALSVTQALEIKNTAIKNNLVYVLTHGYTGYPMIKQARHLVQEGVLGKILNVNVEYAQGWLSPLLLDPKKFKTWHLNSEISGPSCTMMDIGIHALNLVQTIVDIVPIEVCSDLGAIIPGNKLDVSGSVLIHYSKDVRGILHASQISTGEGNALRLKIYGTKAGLSWDQEHPEILEVMNSDGSSTIHKKGSETLCEEARRATNFPSGHPEGFICAFANVYKGGLSAIRSKNSSVGSCHTGRPGIDFPDADQGILGLSFVESILESNTSKIKWVPVNLYATK